jgi:hypothetical protein
VLGWPPVDVVPPLPPVVAVPEEVHCRKRVLNASSTSRERWGYMALLPGWALLENWLTPGPSAPKVGADAEATQGPRTAIAVAPAATSSI